jgi:hypothetical protein
MIHPYFDLSGSDARGLLYGLMEVDKIQLRENPSMPSMRQLVQDGRVKYRRADPEEHWQSYKELVDQVEANGVAYGDCEDLASAIAAEDQVRYGVLSLPYAYTPREGLFHVVTAVPKGQFGGIPQHHWPDAQYAPEIMGYVLQDPSVAAGMGSFGGLPAKEVPAMSSYGAAGRYRYGRAPEPPRRRGLGRLIGSFTKGLLGQTTATDVAHQLGRGAASGAGIEEGWAAQLGKSIPGQLGISAPQPSAAPGGAPVSQGEADTIASLREGAATEAVEQGVSDQELEDEELLEMEDEEFGRMWFEDDPDFDFDDEDEEMGYEPEDWIGSPAWQADQVANRVADDMFGLYEDDEFGLFKKAIATAGLRKRGRQTRKKIKSNLSNVSSDQLRQRLTSLRAAKAQKGRIVKRTGAKGRTRRLAKGDVNKRIRLIETELRNRGEHFGAVDDDVYTMGILHGSLQPSVHDAHESVQARGVGRSLYQRPMVTFGELADEDDDEFGFDEDDEFAFDDADEFGFDEDDEFGLDDDEDDEFGAFWHKKSKRKQIVEGKLKKLLAAGKDDTKKYARLLKRYERLGGDEDDLEDDEETAGFGFISSEHLFGADEDEDDLVDDIEMAELEELDLRLSAEGF